MIILGVTQHPVVAGYDHDVTQSVWRQLESSAGLLAVEGQFNAWCGRQNFKKFFRDARVVKIYSCETTQCAMVNDVRVCDRKDDSGFMLAQPTVQ
jgi:hypothetical protein